MKQKKDKGESTTNVSFYISKERKKQLDELAEMHFRTVSEQIRYLIEKALKEEGIIVDTKF